MFIDETRIKAKAGDGGRGCVSFRREKYEPRGGPNGGDGGKGGDVILVGSANENHLIRYKFQPNWEAERGEHGRGSDQRGRGGRDCELAVPLGTLVTEEKSGKLVAEILRPGERRRLLKGGNGGWGNKRFKSSVNRAPRRANDGEPGESGTFRLVLKSIADIGLVGCPNAGKSTLVNLLTNARPKTAAYPFTTLQPQIGVIEYPEWRGRLLLADIPGLVEGASENRGLGHRFLRHIERCALLALVIDMAGVDGRDPADDYAQLLRELDAYASELLEKPRLVVANKMDLPAAAERLPAFRRACSALVHPLSCLTGEGLTELKERLWETAEAAKAARESAEKANSENANGASARLPPDP